MSHFAQEIIPGLWIGDIQSAHNVKFLKEKNIQCVINCTESFPFCPDYKILIQERIPVKDNMQLTEIQKLHSYLNNIVNKIYNCLKDTHVLVHCHAGKQRSATVICAFLMKFGNLSKEDAIDVLKSKRDWVFTPQINFEPALDKFAHDLCT